MGWRLRFLLTFIAHCRAVLNNLRMVIRNPTASMKWASNDAFAWDLCIGSPSGSPAAYLITELCLHVYNSLIRIKVARNKVQLSSKYLRKHANVLTGHLHATSTSS